MDDACQWVEDELTKLMPGRYFSVEGLGQIEMHTGSKRTTWDKEGLIDVLVHAIGRTMPNLFNADTGEEVNLLDHVRMLVTMFTDAATPSWKVTGLRSYGIDPGDYCETSYGRKTIQLPALPKSTDTLYPSSE
jgi:hypothetical protein